MKRLIGLGAAAALAMTMSGVASAQQDQQSQPQANQDQSAPQLPVVNNNADEYSQPPVAEQNAFATLRQNQAIANGLNGTATKAQNQTALNAQNESNANAQNETALNQPNGTGNTQSSFPSSAGQSAQNQQSLYVPFAGPENAQMPLMWGEPILDSKGMQVGKIAQIIPGPQGGRVIVSLDAPANKEISLPAWRIVQTAKGEAVSLLDANQLVNMAAAGNNDIAEHG